MNMLDAESIREPLSGAPGARLETLEVFSEIESTNSYLLDQPAPPAGRFRVVLADHQTAGRGRLNRVWQSPPSSGLCLSMAYTFARLPAQLSGLTLALGIGVVESLQQFGINDINIKWPNDIMAHGRKLGGILTEARNGKADGVKVVAGVGLNIDLPGSMQSLGEASFKNRITDLKQCAGNPPSRLDLSVAVIENLFDCMVRFESGGFGPFHDDWRKYDWLSGRQIFVDMPEGSQSGIADGVDVDGALIVRTDNERRRVITGTITVSDDPDDKE